jgi:DNA-binding transcriptional LysR family regulator
MACTVQVVGAIAKFQFPNAAFRFAKPHPLDAFRRQPVIPRFDLVDIRLLINVADASSMGRGAEKSCLSAPAASNRIKSLEDSFGVKLLYRSNLGVTLTPAGQTFVHHARAVFAQVDHLHDDLNAFASGIRGHVRLWANTTAMTEFLPRGLAAFMASHPDVNVELRERLSHEIVRAVDEGVTDIGIVAGDVQTDRFETLPYRDDRLVLVCCVNHPIARAESVDFVETLGHQYVGLAESSAIHRFLTQAASAAGRKLNSRIEVGNFEALCRLAEAGVGLGVVPETAATRYAATMRIRVIRLRDAWALRKLRICVRSLEQLPSFARDLVDALIDGTPRLTPSHSMASRSPAAIAAAAH